MKIQWKGSIPLHKYKFIHDRANINVVRGLELIKTMHIMAFKYNHKKDIAELFTTLHSVTT